MSCDYIILLADNRVYNYIISEKDVIVIVIMTIAITDIDTDDTF
jgi:hypothetical protein